MVIEYERTQTKRESDVEEVLFMFGDMEKVSGSNGTGQAEDKSLRYQDRCMGLTHLSLM